MIPMIDWFYPDTVNGVCVYLHTCKANPQGEYPCTVATIDVVVVGVVAVVVMLNKNQTDYPVVIEHSYGKSPFHGKIHYFYGHVHSHVKLPEGMTKFVGNNFLVSALPSW